jgi:preprotein translocase subunit SecB
MSAAGNGTNEGNADGGPQPRIHIVGQYVKDLSFENPGAPASVAQRPAIDLGVDLQARPVSPEHFEVELKLRVTAKAEDKPLFLLELVYAGLFHLQAIPEDVIQQVLLIDGPHMLFPFARRIVADVIRDGGMPPLMIEPIDFAGLYRARTAQMQQTRTGSAGVA